MSPNKRFVGFLVAVLSAAITAMSSAQSGITIGVSLPQDDNPFYIAMLRGIRASAQERG